MDNVMVSVWCLTYNHVEYIRDTLEGILAQETDFPYEILIYDDASTDGTSEIVREYAEKYPEIIRAVIGSENIYHSPDRWKIISNLKKKYLTGKYIAYCEGDDLWLDCRKLQIQVEYMEKHPECSMYLHNALWLNCKDGSMKAGNYYPGNDEQDISAEEIIMQYKFHPPMASLLFQRDLIESPVFFLKAPVGDYPILLYALAKGNLHYSNRIMSLYRWQGNGSYSARIKEDPDLLFHFNMGLLDFFIQYDQYTDYRYHVWCINKIHLFASSIIEHVDNDMTIRDCLYRSKKHGYKFSESCENYIEELERLRKQIFDRKYCSDYVKNFVRKFENIVIMGAGKYGAVVAEQLESNGMDFAGFAVSKKNEKDSYLGKPVWNLSELPFDKEKMGIIIAINPLRWDTILNALENAGIGSYYCPFLISLGN